MYDDLKSKLTITFIEDKADFNQSILYGLCARWRGFPVYRKAVILKTFITKGFETVIDWEYDEETEKKYQVTRKYPIVDRFLTPEEIKVQKENSKSDLIDWFKRMVLNYSDLSYAQKRRLKKNPIEDYGSKKFATLKYLRVREPPKCKKHYILVYKLVIIKLIV